jgi:hypothetical protein
LCGDEQVAYFLAMWWLQLFQRSSMLRDSYCCLFPRISSVSRKISLL